MVKETLGEDAIIVATREEAGGRSVRVTAAIEQTGSSQFHAGGSMAGGNMIGNDAPEYDGRDFAEEFSDEFDDELMEEHENENAITEALTDIMLKHRIPSDLSEHIMSCTGIVALPDARDSLTAAIEHLFNFRPIPDASSYKRDGKKAKTPQCVMFVGPPGAGKTLAVAKMAARAVMNEKNVTTITTDIVRAGGYEQLRAFTKILGADLHRAKNAVDLKEQLKQSQGADLILVDTAGVNPFSTTDIKELAQLKACGNIESVLVLPAGLDPEEASDMARVFSTLGVQWLMPTRLDMARRFGGLLAAASVGGMTFAEGSHTAQVAQGLVDMTPQTIVSYLMPQKKQKKKLGNINPQINTTRQYKKKHAQ